MRSATDPATVLRLAWSVYRSAWPRPVVLAAPPLLVALALAMPFLIRLEATTRDIYRLSVEWLPRILATTRRGTSAQADFRVFAAFFDEITRTIAAALIPGAIVAMLQTVAIVLAVGVTAAALPSRPGEVLGPRSTLARLRTRWPGLVALSIAVSLFLNGPSLLGAAVMAQAGTGLEFPILALLMSVYGMIVFVLFIVGIVAIGRLSMAVPLVAQEPIGLVEAVRASRELSRGVATDIAVCVGLSLLGIALLVSVPGLIASATLLGDPLRSGAGIVIIPTVLGMLTWILGAPYLSIVLSLLRYRVSEARGWGSPIVR
jgi:hypothetical protein